MALGLSTPAANALLDSGINTLFDNGTINIYDGTRPATAGLSEAGTLLAQMSLTADSFAAAASGTIVGSTPWQEASALAASDATWFRIKTSGDTDSNGDDESRIDGDVAAAGSDLNLSTITINIGDQITITQFDLSA